MRDHFIDLICGAILLTALITIPTLLVSSLLGCESSNGTVNGTVADMDAPAAPSFVRNCPNFLYQNRFRMVRIPASTFTMGNDLVGGDFRTPKFRTSIDTFWIDKYEVTVNEFLFFVEESGYVVERRGFYLDGEIQFQNLGEPGHPAQVTWRDAWAYAAWVGKRLPTEKEWEKAARGSREDEVFTWGNNQPTPGHRRGGFAAQGGFAVAGGRQHFNGKWLTGIRNDLQYVFDTGLYAPNGYDLFDMIGNVDEWCQDDWNPNAYMLFMLDPALQVIKVEGKAPGSIHMLSDWKVVRGGGLRHSIFVASHRESYDGLTIQQQHEFIFETVDVGERGTRHMAEYYLVGFRCAMDD